MSNTLQRILICRRVTERQAESEMWRRVGAKAAAYLRGLTLATDVGLTPTEKANVGACECGVRTSHPHLHVFDCVVPLTHFTTPHDAALAVAASHTFRHLGSHVTWGKNKPTKDHVHRHYQRWRAAVRQATTLADKYRKARHLLQSGNRKAKVRACETLGLDVSKHAQREIWKDALRQRRTGGAKSPRVGKRRQAPIQTYRCVEG